MRGAVQGDVSGLIQTESGNDFGSAAAGTAAPRPAITTNAEIVRSHPRIVTGNPSLAGTLAQRLGQGAQHRCVVDRLPRRRLTTGARHGDRQLRDGARLRGTTL